MEQKELPAYVWYYVFDTQVADCTVPTRLISSNSTVGGGFFQPSLALLLENHAKIRVLAVHMLLHGVSNARLRLIAALKSVVSEMKTPCYPEASRLLSNYLQVQASPEVQVLHVSQQTPTPLQRRPSLNAITSTHFA
jgi:hypothetical protein